MTARDEAIAAMQDADDDWGVGGYGPLLDAIPADVLAQLAIDRGGLIAHDTVWAHIPNSAGGNFVPLYRLATDNDQ
jgi:hypothetical protein